MYGLRRCSVVQRKHVSRNVLPLSQNASLIFVFIAESSAFSLRVDPRRFLFANSRLSPKQNNGPSPCVKNLPCFVLTAGLPLGTAERPRKHVQTAVPRCVRSRTDHLQIDHALDLSGLIICMICLIYSSCCRMGGGRIYKIYHCNMYRVFPRVGDVPVQILHTVFVTAG